MELKLDGQVAIVTGASRGIGAAIADTLAAAGARVAGTATTAPGAAAIGERTEFMVQANKTAPGSSWPPAPVTPHPFQFSAQISVNRRRAVSFWAAVPSSTRGMPRSPSHSIARSRSASPTSSSSTVRRPTCCWSPT